MATASAEKIKELLSNGLSNDVVATAVGVHPSYVSQLMSDEVFSAEVIARRTQTLADVTVRDRSWDGLEDKLLIRMHEIVDNQMIYKPQDVIRALVVVNNAKRRGNTAQESLVVHQNIVNLSIPAAVVNNYTKNITGEVVEVTSPDGQQQTLVTMQAATLMSKLAEQHQGKKEYDQIRKYLPTSESS